MEQQLAAPPGFCACPPACLAILGDDKAVQEKLHEVFIDEARELQSRLREQLSQVRTELGFFLRLMYKNKNQHRRSLYYRRLSEVKRDLQMLNSSGLDVMVESFTKFFAAKRPDGVLSKAAKQSKTKDAIDESKALCTLLGVARLLNQTHGPIMAGSVHLAGLLGQSFFMPFALTMFSCLARFRVLLIQVLYEVVTAFNLLSAHFQKKKKVSVAIQLECRWDGVKLCMTEKKLASVLQNKITKSHTLATPLWFVDDRTGVKYDLGVPSAIPGSGGEAEHANLPVSSNVSKGSTNRAHEVERTASLGLDLEAISSHVCRLGCLEDIARPSGDDVMLPAVISSGAVDTSEVRESFGQRPDSSARNSHYKQDLRTGSAMEKGVAYISISHKIPQDSTTKSEMAQNLQGFSTRDVADRGIKQVKADQFFGFEGGMRHSIDREIESLVDVSLNVDSANGIQSIQSVSVNLISMDVVQSGTSIQDPENIEVKQEITEAPIQNTLVDSHGLESAFRDEIDMNNQIDAAISSSRPLEKVYVMDAFKASVPNTTIMMDALKASVANRAIMMDAHKASAAKMAIMEDSCTVQTASCELRPTMDHNAEHSDPKVVAVDRAGHWSMLTSQQDIAGGDGPTTMEGSKVNAVTIESSQNGVVDQNGSKKLVLNRPVSGPLEEKSGCLNVPSPLQTNIEGGAILTSDSLGGKAELEIGEETLKGTHLQTDFESDHLDRPNANLSVTSNSGLPVVVDAATLPTTVHLKGELSHSGTGLSNGVDSSRVSVSNVSLKSSFPYISVNTEINSNWKEDRTQTVVDEYQEAGCDQLTINLPKRMDLEGPAEQRLRKNVSPSTLNTSQRAKSGVKMPLAYVSAGADGRTPQKKRKEYDGKRKARIRQNVDLNTKQQLPIGLKHSPTVSEAKRGKDDSTDATTESESKKKKANDIFAMLLGGSD